mmetsp:Transcript_7177/g.13164  ORF Transcript_7177/g.13164 Transcript_7177/m.13164 type:complete len:96 (+) Transcript_7177:792-1079(+)
MEISHSHLQGFCELLDVPVDDFQDFVSQFNSAIASEFRPTATSSVKYIADPSNIRRDGSLLELKWRVEVTTAEDQVSEGTAVYDLSSKRMQLRGI